MNEQQIRDALWGSRFRPKTTAKMVVLMVTLIQVITVPLAFAFGYHGPKLLAEVLTSSASMGWIYTFIFSGLGLLYRADGIMPRRTRSGAAAAISLILPALIGVEYFVSTQIRYFQPPKPDLLFIVGFALTPLLCFGIVWLCDVVRKA